jgi:hypothetical protein
VQKFPYINIDQGSNVFSVCRQDSKVKESQSSKRRKSEREVKNLSEFVGISFISFGLLVEFCKLVSPGFGLI